MNFIPWIQKHEKTLKELAHIFLGISIGMLLAVLLIKLGVPLGI